jgi:hypothetical protein
MNVVIGICLYSVEESPSYRNRALVSGLGIVSLSFPLLVLPYSQSILFSPVRFNRGNLSRLLSQA